MPYSAAAAGASAKVGESSSITLLDVLPRIIPCLEYLVGSAVKWTNSPRIDDEVFDWLSNLAINLRQIVSGPIPALSLSAIPVTGLVPDLSQQV